MAGREWTTEEDDALREAYAAPWPLHPHLVACGTRISRSVSAMYSRAGDLRLGARRKIGAHGRVRRARKTADHWSAGQPRSGSMFVAQPPEPRFWAKVNKRGECWVWTGSLSNNGYGQFGAKPGRLMLAHRFSYEIAYGPIPEGKHVCHRCDNPACVRPDHLFVGTAKDNMRDMTSKGRNGAHTHPERVLRGTRVHGAKLNEAKVREALDRVAAGETRTAVAKSMGVSLSAISNLCSGHTWRSARSA